MVGYVAAVRQRALDLVRGGIMILMVLDHARDFYMGFGVDPTDLATTTPVLFLTRWVTHYCAPGFIVLAGASAYLYGRKRSASERRRFLLTRGVWLVFLEVTVVRFGWIPDPTYSFTMLQVIWAIGCSMVILAPLSALPPRALAIGGLVMVATHNLLDTTHFDSFLWAVFHERGRFEPVAGHTLSVMYPLVPWVGVMALGFGLGDLYTRPAKERQRWLLGLGLGACAAFFVVRGINVYGDPAPWSVQRDTVTTVLSFLDTEKYPPSLDYLLMTLGPILLALLCFERFRAPELLARPLEIFGRVPLFFYITHIYLLRSVGIALAFWRWGDVTSVVSHGGTAELPLYAAYLAWLAALAILLPICRWYGKLKERRSADWWWLSYA